MASTAMTVASRTERECLRAAGLLGLGVAAAVVLAWASSFPGWPIAAGIVLSALVLAALMLIFGTEPPNAGRWLRPAGVLGALVVAIGGGIVIEQSTGAALLTRFERSRPSFDAAVAAAGPVPLAVSDHWLPFPGECPTRLGSYRIADCHGFTGGFMFLQQRDALGDDAGFAYAPNGLLTTPDGQNGMPSTGFTHLAGPWYGWSCDC